MLAQILTATSLLPDKCLNALCAYYLSAYRIGFAVIASTCKVGRLEDRAEEKSFAFYLPLQPAVAKRGYNISYLA